MYYNAYAVWREVSGKAEINLRDSRYGYRAAVLSCAREFGRRAMAECLTDVRKNMFTRQRQIVMFILFFLGEKYLEM